MGLPCHFLFVFLLLSTTIVTIQAYFVNDEPAYLAQFPALIASSYSSPRPLSLISACTSGLPAPYPLPEVYITHDMDAISFQMKCGISSLCIIQPGVTVTLNADVNVAAIINKGTILWNDQTQQSSSQYLCSGYIVTEANGVFSLSLLSRSKTAFIYIKANRAVHDPTGVRVFGGYHRNSLPGYPRVEVTGSPLRRAWSLLSENAKRGDTFITLMHDAELMGWKVGDRIAISPTQRLATADAQSFFIKSVNKTLLFLAADENLLFSGALNQDYVGDEAAYMQAEVMLMSRNVIITGDDFQQYPCGDNICSCTFPGHVCTVGLHTIMHGNNTRFGGTYRIQHTRVEKCGQRGAKGRYCIHFHTVRDCPDCLAHGNAVEFGQQRGIVVHDTHLSMVSENTLYDVRGAGIYVEDGNEMYNHIEYNVVLCPYAFNGPKQGCTVPGTDNQVADTSDNQAAFWSLTHTNHFIGNRAANSYNGILFHPSFAFTGRGLAYGSVCVNYVPLGRVEGNTCHGNGRFGIYFASSDWPRKLGTNVSNNGFTTEAQCVPFDSEGYDRGYPASLWNNVDYHNAFVGSYGLGDVQFRNHISIDNNNLIYNKESKNFADGCSAHYKNFHFEDGSALLASGWGTILFEDSTFAGHFNFESNHHCGIAATGVLCNPQYIFTNPTWQVTSTKWITWNDANNPTRGSVYNLAPPDSLLNMHPFSPMFPKGFQGVCHGYHTYLLQLDQGRTCVTSKSLEMELQYENGILCKKPLRRLEIYTQGLNYATAGTVELIVSQNNVVVATTNMIWFMIPEDTRKQGFTIPIIASLDYDYRLARKGGIPTSWIIEFSDPIIGNRWTPDQIKLQADGRVCPPITTSQHDRRWIYASEHDGFSVPGRGACSPYPDMPKISCVNQPDIPLMSCPESCGPECSGPNKYCDCGSGRCMCAPGFSGDSCEVDICESARCIHGKCTARYLGGNLPPVRDVCMCDAPYAGPTCDTNPCTGRTCSGRGVCHSHGEMDAYCECQPGFSGLNCETTCDGFCTGNGGEYPYFCSTVQDAPSFCNREGGCAYSVDYFKLNSSWCCYEYCDPCYGITCDSPFNTNDCVRPAHCVNGQCHTSSLRPDGSVCHSQPWGTCLSGTCTSNPRPAQGSSDTLGTSILWFSDASSLNPIFILVINIISLALLYL